MQIEKNIAATLQRKMKAAGKTKLEFSRELGIPRSTFQEYLKDNELPVNASASELIGALRELYAIDERYTTAQAAAI